MDNYTFLRELADSWVLLAMVLFYLGACVRAVLPNRRSANEEAAGIPFRDEALPNGASATAETPACDRNCETCACTGAIPEFSK